jgi:hypothetical protein
VIRVRFAGDQLRTSSETEGQIFVFRPVPFVIWGGNAEGVLDGQSVTLYAPDWSKQVSSGDYRAAFEFKGLAETVSLPGTRCQATASTTHEPRLTPGCWSAAPGIEPPPIPSETYVGVMIATSIDKQQAAIFGNIAAVAVVTVDPTDRKGIVTGKVISVEP